MSIKEFEQQKQEIIKFLEDNLTSFELLLNKIPKEGITWTVKHPLGKICALKC